MSSNTPNNADDVKNLSDSHPDEKLLLRSQQQSLR